VVRGYSLASKGIAKDKQTRKTNGKKRPSNQHSLSRVKDCSGNLHTLS